MAKSITIPSGGLPLSEFPVDLDAKKKNLRQAIEIESIGEESLDKIISGLKNGVEVQVQLGKKPVIMLDKKVIPIETTYHAQSLLFKQSKGASRLELTASLNLKDALARIKLARSRDIDMKDPDIVALQAKMAGLKEQKDANKTQVINPNLAPKNGKSALAGLKNHRQGMFGGSSTSRSSPASPAIGSATPQPVKKDRQTIRADMIKRAFIHTIAVRPATQKYLMDCVAVPVADIEPLLQKYGKLAPDGKKYSLSDRGYKEVDPWSFLYKDENLRQAVIEGAITAFDRMRIPTTDTVWQKLLKPEERGKGKTLSRLGIPKTGPIERVKTPKLQVEASSEGDLKDRGRLLAPSNDDSARSQSQESVNKKKPTTASSTPTVKPVKSTTTTKNKEAEMARAQQDKKKESPLKKEVKPVVKKPTSAKPAPTSGKVKSAEFIEDSDEEIKTDELAKQSFAGPSNKRKAEDDPSPASKKVDTKKVAPKPGPKPTIEVGKKPVIEKVVPKTKAQESVKKPQEESGKKVTSVPASQTQSKKPTSQQAPRTSVPMARSISAKKGTSPVKPSPLGSSPPTNASDFENDKFNKANSTKSSSSSSSGSPLINQRRERLQLEAKRKAAVPTPSINSDKNLKRRVNDLENGNHANGGFSTRGASSTSSSEPPTKRPRAESSLSASDSEKSNASSNTAQSIVLGPKDIEYARSFKEQWQKYAEALRELSALSDPPPEKIERLQRQYAKLKHHKDIIYGWEKGQMA